jgi:hypothetical protein
LQGLLGDGQIYPVSNWQTLLHPSAEIILPSSQPSDCTIKPSPQTAIHNCP